MVESNKYFNKKWDLSTITPLFLLFIAIPASMVLWVGNIAFTRLKTGSGEVIPPTRWLAATLIPVAFAAWGYKRKSVSRSGAVAGLVIAFILTLASYAFLADLIVFFVTSSQASKFKARSKDKLSEEFKEGAQRNWIQALCNGGMAAQLALLYLLDSGSGEHVIDFSQGFRSSWLSVGVLGAFACSNADTWASELGTVISTNDPFLITTRVRVPRGTNGGVTWIGLFLSAAGGAVIGLAHLIGTRASSLPPSAPPQWPLIPLAALTGLIGSVVDSILGATLQYSGFDKKKRIVVETPGPDVDYICGHRILDNNSVNLISTIATAIITPRIAVLFWPR